MEEKKILANRVYSDETLKRWKKEDLIEQIRILEHNWASAEESLNIQAKNCEMLLKQKEKDTARDICKIAKRHNKDCQINIERLIMSIASTYGIEVE